MSVTHDEVVAALERVEDPHLPAHIVELGMVESVEVDGPSVRVELTLPCLGCPARSWISDEAATAVRSLAGVDDVEIVVRWDREWTKLRVTAGARARMAQVGVTL